MSGYEVSSESEWRFCLWNYQRLSVRYDIGLPTFLTTEAGLFDPPCAGILREAGPRASRLTIFCRGVIVGAPAS